MASTSSSSSSSASVFAPWSPHTDSSRSTPFSTSTACPTLFDSDTEFDQVLESILGKDFLEEPVKKVKIEEKKEEKAPPPEKKEEEAPPPSIPIVVEVSPPTMVTVDVIDLTQDAGPTPKTHHRTFGTQMRNIDYEVAVRVCENKAQIVRVDSVPLQESEKKWVVAALKRKMPEAQVDAVEKRIDQIVCGMDVPIWLVAVPKPSPLKLCACAHCGYLVRPVINKFNTFMLVPVYSNNMVNVKASDKNFWSASCMVHLVCAAYCWRKDFLFPCLCTSHHDKERSNASCPAYALVKKEMVVDDDAAKVEKRKRERTKYFALESR